MIPVTLLVMAKAPVPGLAKTRLAHTIGNHLAAVVAAAALLAPALPAFVRGLLRGARTPSPREHPAAGKAEMSGRRAVTGGRADR